MMKALHLIWIIPLVAWFGFFTAVMCGAAGKADRK